MGVDYQPQSTHQASVLGTMEAIKKKMQAMKVEKDNACDRVDVCEEACKQARIRAGKGEDEVDELMTKSRQLETELDLTAEKLGIVSLQLEEKEKQLSATELEMAALQRRVSGLEEDLEKTEQKMVAAVAKLDKAATSADDSERAKKVFQSKAEEDEKRIIALEKDLKEAREKLRLLIISMMSVPSCSLPASPTWRKPRRGQMSGRPRSSSWRRSSRWWLPTSSPWRLLRRRLTRGRRPTRNRSRP